TPCIGIRKSALPGSLGVNRKNHILTQALGALCGAMLRGGHVGVRRRRFANQPPPASAPAMVQKTGSIPSAAPTPPNASGSIVWLALSTTERMPTASPARPGGALA